MRYKQHTVSKLEGQIAQLKTLQRLIETRSINAQDAIQYINSVIKSIELVVERLELEPNE